MAIEECRLHFTFIHFQARPNAAQRLTESAPDPLLSSLASIAAYMCHKPLSRYKYKQINAISMCLRVPFPPFQPPLPRINLNADPQ